MRALPSAVCPYCGSTRIKAHLQQTVFSLLMLGKFGRRQDRKRAECVECGRTFKLPRKRGGWFLGIGL